MGTFDTLLGIAGLGVSVANSAKLSQLREQNELGNVLGLQEAERRATQQKARDILFELNRAVQDAQVLASQNTVRAVGQLRYLEFLANDAGLTTSLFDSLEDKSFADKFWRTLTGAIRDNYEKLEEHERVKTNELKDALVDYDDASFYLAFITPVNRYRDALTITRTSGSTGGGGGFLFGAVILAVLTLFMLCGASLISAVGVGGLGVIYVGMAVLFGAGTYFCFKKYREKKANHAPMEEANKTITAFETMFSKNALTIFERRESSLAARGYQGEAQITSLQSRSERIVTDFFGDKPSLGLSS